MFAALCGKDAHPFESRLPPEQGGQTPAIALTGYVSPEDRHHAMEVGYQEHLSKPVDIDELLNLVRKLIR